MNQSSSRRQATTVFEVLADPRRRRALELLVEHHETTLPDLAELVAESETGMAVGRGLSEARVQETYFELYHSHVPKLEAADLVCYDQEGDRIAVSDGMVPTVGQAIRRLSALIGERPAPR